MMFLLKFFSFWAIFYSVLVKKAVDTVWEFWEVQLKLIHIFLPIVINKTCRKLRLSPGNKIVKTIWALIFWGSFIPTGLYGLYLVYDAVESLADRFYKDVARPLMQEQADDLDSNRSGLICVAAATLYNKVQEALQRAVQ